MSDTLIANLTKTAEGMRLYQQERLILEVTELICQVMEEGRVKKSDLAKRLGKSKGYVTQLLDGRANMTLRTLADVFWALDRTLSLSSEHLHTGWESWAPGDEPPVIKVAWDSFDSDEPVASWSPSHPERRQDGDRPGEAMRLTA